MCAHSTLSFLPREQRSDLLFEVIDAQGELVYLHIELQGLRSPEPMPLRMLDYLARIIRRDIGVPQKTQALRLHSVVVYIGDGAGRGDTGQYEVLGLGEVSTLRWQYQPLRLWEIDAEMLFTLDNPAFLALVGQTRLRQPEVVLPKAIASIRQASEAEQKERLLTALISLLPNEEVTKMVEQLLEQSDELLDTPYLRKMRRIGWEQGRKDGREEGREEGLRQAILDGLIRRFDPPVSEYRAIEAALEVAVPYATLLRVHAALFDTGDIAAFRVRLDEELKQ